MNRICSLFTLLNSKNRKYIYVGLTNNVERILNEHNGLKEKTTRSYAPFELILYEEFKTRMEARVREKQLKSGAGKEWLKKEFGL